MPSLLNQIERVTVDKLTAHPNNPRRGNVGEIAKSLKQNKQYSPLVVQKSTGYILSGNHTYMAAVSLGWKEVDVVYVDVDDDTATRILLSANRTADMASYDMDLLTGILKSLPDPEGTGYDDSAVRALLAGMDNQDSELIEDVLRPPVKIEFTGSDDEDLDTKVAELQARHDARYGPDPAQPFVNDSEEMRVAQSVMDIQLHLETFQDSYWPSTNYYGIPDLRTDMLLDVLPDPLDTWGGVEATPDDGVTTWIWNFGVAATKGLPWDRSILSFFTYDTKFAQWWDEPAYQTARVFHNGVRKAIVPDYSFWVDSPRFEHLQSQYRAQWLGRFFQEAGIKVIPRLMWTDIESIKTGLLGIPKKPPIAAVCIQAINKKEMAQQMSSEGLRLMVKEVEPDALIVYSGNPGREVVEEAHLPKSVHVVCCDNYAAKRRHVVFDRPEGKLAVAKAARKNKAQEQELVEADQ